MAKILVHQKRSNGAIQTYKFTLGNVDSKGNHELETGEVSDGYHTFHELYRYRMLYNAAFANEYHVNYGRVVKSYRHADGELCFGKENYFVVVMNLPTGQISNHYKGEFWDLFQVEEVERAPEWDGHTPQDAAERLEKYLRGDWAK